MTLHDIFLVRFFSPHGGLNCNQNRQGDEAASPFSINLSAMKPLTMQELHDVCKEAERMGLHGYDCTDFDGPKHIVLLNKLKCTDQTPPQLPHTTKHTKYSKHTKHQAFPFAPLEWLAFKSLAV